MEKLLSPWREDFAALQRPVHADGDGGVPLAFWDSAASAHKPRAVVDALRGALEGGYANIHRGLYENSALTTAAYEAARGRIAAFLGHVPEGTVLVRSATEGLNLVVQTWGKKHLKAGDVVVLTVLEHHANIVPWQLLQAELGFAIEVIGLGEDGGLDMARAAEVFGTGNVKALGLTQMSNVLGLCPDVAALAAMARAAGAVTVVDGSQGAVHEPVDFAAMEADFYVMTGHKLYGPNGVGAVLASPAMWESLPPWQGGGDMIEAVRFEGTTFAPPPARFEAGTPPIAEVIALGAACDYVAGIGWEALRHHEAALAAAMAEGMADVPGFVRYSPVGSGIVAFNLEGAHYSDVAVILDQCGVAVRSGHHCAMPLMAALGIDGCVRASAALYNNGDDVVQLVEALHKAARLLKVA